MRNILVSILLFVGLTQSVPASDWPMYRADAARSGYTPDALPRKLALWWTYAPRHAPMPAWVHTGRMPYDHTYHVVVVDGTLYFGSSADGKVYALNAASGEERWTFFTGAPVRFAPAVWRDRVFVVSDDGFLYCLKAANGALLWKKRGGPNDDMLLGNDRLIARWPARGGVVIADGIAYFGAGIWQSEGIYLYALNAETGDVLWVNDSSGIIEMNQPHPTARAKSGVSAQGYFVVAGDDLIVPTGRSVPAVFRRADGEFRYFHLQKFGAGIGGTSVMAVDDYFLNSSRLFDCETGESRTNLRDNATAVSPKYVVYATGGQLKAVDRANLVVERDAVDRKGNPTRKRTLNDPAWTIDVPDENSVSLIIAGQSAVLGTADKHVMMVNIASKSVAWTAEVDGVPLGLAAADGRLYVSTDLGTIYCFGKHGWLRKPKRVEQESTAAPYGANTAYAAAAEEIIAKTSVTEGYCVDLECGEGQLAYELARRTRLNICAIDPDPANVRAARQKLDAAGLYGVRVTVHQADLDAVPYPKRFANLIVSGRAVEDGAASMPMDAMVRVQRPFGGVACMGKRAAMEVNVRGTLPGAGAWTHQYCTPANNNCSTDTIIKAPLRMLWFRDSDFVMPSRHGRGPASVFYEGRLFVEGLDALRAVDAYNGRPLWEYPLENILKQYDQEHLVGASATGSNLCVAGKTVYVHTKDRCLKLDTATGRKYGEIETPLRPEGNKGTWGFIAVEDGTLYGSLANTEHITHWAYRGSDMSGMFPESVAFFAMDAATGRLKWTYTAKDSIRNNTIAIGNGRVHLIDRPVAVRDRTEHGKEEHPPGELVTLDAATGEVVWRNSDDIYGTMLALSTKHDVLLMSYQDTRFKLNSELGGRLTAFRASDGTRLWDVEAQYESRPVIHDTTIYMQPGAWDLLSGEPKRITDPETGEGGLWQFSRSYGCGTIAGSPKLLVFRSATLGYIDLLHEPETHNYGGIRPGCWINTLPAGGLLLMPDTTHRCICSYPLRASIALEAME